MVSNSVVHKESLEQGHYKKNIGRLQNAANFWWFLTKKVFFLSGDCFIAVFALFSLLQLCIIQGRGKNGLSTNLFMHSAYTEHGFHLKTVFRCLSPLKIGIHIYLEQSVWAELSWNPFQKRIASILFGPNHSGEKNLGPNLDVWKSYFQFLRWNWVFRTYMEINAAVTLHFDDLAVKNHLFLKDMCICWWKISNCLPKHYW